MSKYKYNIIGPDSKVYEYDEIFDTEEEARAEALYSCSCSKEGAEILHTSNPSEYDFDESDQWEYEIIEIDDDGEEYTLSY